MSKPECRRNGKMPNDQSSGGEVAFLYGRGHISFVPFARAVLGATSLY